MLSLFVKCILITSIALMAKPAEARNEVQRDFEVSNIQYEPASHPLGLVRSDALDREIAKLGLINISDSLRPVMTRLDVSQVWVSEDMTEFLAIRYDYKLKESSFEGRTLQLPNNQQLVHTRTRSRRELSIFFEGFTSSQRNRIKFVLEENSPGRRSSAFALLSEVIPSALAAYPALRCGEHQSVISLKTPAVASGGATIFKNATTCAVGAVHAITDVALGTSVRFLFGSWATSLHSVYKTLKEGVGMAISKIVSEFVDLRQNAEILANGDLLWPVVCYLLTSFTVNAGINWATAAMTGGAALTTLPLMFGRWLRTVKNVARIIETIKTDSTFIRASESVRRVASIKSVSTATNLAGAVIMNWDPKGFEADGKMMKVRNVMHDYKLDKTRSYLSTMRKEAANGSCLLRVSDQALLKPALYVESKIRSRSDVSTGNVR